MKRALVFLLRFVSFLRGNRNTSPLSAQEVQRAERILIYKSQREVFANEIMNLSAGKPVKYDSCLKSLNPFIDADGMLRVGGRIKESGVENKHPYIIHAKHPLTAVIARDAHSYGHLGVQWVLSIIRKHFWIVKGRRLIKRMIKSCITCRRLYAKPCVQIMADLPRDRLEINRPPFTVVGVDIFGPFFVKYGRAEIKRYGCLYTCFGCRAVHIEKLDSMDTDSFLNGFRRFIARRGRPETVYSDLGTNLVGGHSELKRAMKEVSESVIMTYSAKTNVTWHFRPPSASHWGGIWERMIGIVRRIMPAILSNTRLTDEILETVFCEVESMINGRPLTKLNDSPDDLAPLTPNHLLLSQGNVSGPPWKFVEADMLRKRWRHVQHLANQFWRKWLRAYLPELQRRVKWTRECRNVAKHDLVIIADEMTPRNVWPLAIVKEVMTGRDGMVRSVKLRTTKNELVRPITKIVLLEASNDADCWLGNNDNHNLGYEWLCWLYVCIILC